MTSSPPSEPGPPASNEITNHTELVRAELVLWRVFGLTDIYEDRPRPGWSVEETRGPGAHDQLQITVGDPPADLLLALQQWNAQKPALLEMLLGGPGTHEHRQQRYEAEWLDAVPTEFADPYPLWFALRLVRPMHLRANPGAVVGWVGNDDVATAAMTKFEDEGNRYVDGAVARMLKAIWPMSLGRLCFPGRRAFLRAPDRAAIMISRVSLNVADWGAQVTRAGGWEAAPTETITEALRTLPTGKPLGGRTVRSAEWFSAALAEDDDLSRFVFAFAGLELLATQVEKDVRNQLIGKIATTNPELPATELLWPSTDEDRATRNLVFRFAAMASVYSPATANHDVGEFRKLHKTRNQLFHGVDRQDLRDQSIQCKELLRRYLEVVAAAEGGATR